MSLEVCTAGGEGECSVGGGGKCPVGGGPSVYKRMVAIEADMTEEAWLEAAQSCERLAPGEDTVMVVRRPRGGQGGEATIS